MSFFSQCSSIIVSSRANPISFGSSCKPLSLYVKNFNNFFNDMQVNLRVVWSLWDILRRFRCGWTCFNRNSIYSGERYFVLNLIDRNLKPAYIVPCIRLILHKFRKSVKPSSENLICETTGWIMFFRGRNNVWIKCWRLSRSSEICLFWPACFLSTCNTIFQFNIEQSVRGYRIDLGYSM